VTLEIYSMDLGYISPISAPRVGDAVEPPAPAIKRKPVSRPAKPAPVVEDERRQLLEQAEMRAMEMARRRGFRG
jgi:hypothetical protein